MLPGIHDITVYFIEPCLGDDEIKDGLGVIKRLFSKRKEVADPAVYLKSARCGCF